MGVRKKRAGSKSELLNEQLIQQRLTSFFSSWKYNADGLYVFNWESDKLIWTKSGYIYEFEIKISRNDFKNDFKNKIDKHIILQSCLNGEKYMPSFWEYYNRNKHLYPVLEKWEEHCRECCKNYFTDYYKKPNYFYYAVPDGLIKPDEVPKYAGLIYVGNRVGLRNFVTVKKAPMLHKQKYTDSELNLSEKFYHNWKNALGRLCEAQRDYADANKRLLQELESKGQDRTYKEMEADLIMAEEGRDYWQKKHGEICRDRMIDRRIIHVLRHELKQINPDFDYDALEEQAIKIYDK